MLLVLVLKVRDGYCGDWINKSQIFLVILKIGEGNYLCSLFRDIDGGGLWPPSNLLFGVGYRELMDCSLIIAFLFFCVFICSECFGLVLQDRDLLDMGLDDLLLGWRLWHVDLLLFRTRSSPAVKEMQVKKRTISKPRNLGDQCLLNT